MLFGLPDVPVKTQGEVITMTKYAFDRILSEIGPFELGYRMRFYPGTIPTSSEPAYFRGNRGIAKTRAQIFDEAPSRLLGDLWYWQAKSAKDWMDVCRSCHGSCEEKSPGWTGPCIMCGGNGYAFTRSDKLITPVAAS